MNTRSALLTSLALLLAGVSLPPLGAPLTSPAQAASAKADHKATAKGAKGSAKTTSKTAASKTTASKTAASKPHAKDSKSAAKTHAKAGAKEHAKGHAKTSAKNGSKSHAAKDNAKNSAKTGAKSSVKSGTKTAVPLASALAKPVPAKPVSAKPVAREASLPASAPLQLAPAAAAAGAAPLALSASSTTSANDLAAIRQAVALVRRGRSGEATALESGVQDPTAAKLIEWLVLRSDGDNSMSHDRYLAFVNSNPGWPSVTTLRRRAEASLWDDKRDASTVRRFFSRWEPTLAKGRIALARVLWQAGDQLGARKYLHAAFLNDGFSKTFEDSALENFGALLSSNDLRARMHARFYAKDIDGAMRMAQRLGGADLAVAKARVAVMHNASNAKALLDAVPSQARSNPGYIFSLCQWLRRNDRYAEAARAISTVPRDEAHIIDPDQWWTERRTLSRELLDAGDARSAYIVARDAPIPERENYKVEHQFMAGWIALRFLNDPKTAATHFARMAESVENPIALARAGYWQGRAAEALGRQGEARAAYQRAARYPTAYYGQIARAKLGQSQMTLRAPPALSAAQKATLSRLEVVRAVDMLYAIGEKDFVAIMAADLADKSDDVGALSLIAEKAAQHGDARAALLAGKIALSRGLPLDHYAFPTFGLPKYSAIGPEVEPSIVYAIARQESGFNPKTVSSAKAYGLMQVTPEAGRYIAKKFRAPYDEKRLLSDTVYNTQMGAAELGDLIRDYRGSYILTFAGYNAGRGRIRTWIARYGDPRDPNVDPIDWVERIPFSETRNYVQRIMENLQVYRTRFGGDHKLLIEADLRRGSSVN